MNMFLTRWQTSKTPGILCPICKKVCTIDEDIGAVQWAGMCMRCYAEEAERANAPEPMVCLQVEPEVKQTIEFVPPIEKITPEILKEEVAIIPVVKPIEVSTVSNPALFDYDKRMEYLRTLGSTTEAGMTYNIGKNNKDEHLFIAHLFGWPYDLWIHDYDEAERVYFWFASFRGLNDQDAEWGYVFLDELLEQNKSSALVKIERDFYWEPKTLEELKGSPVADLPFNPPVLEQVNTPAPAVEVRQYQKYEVVERTTDLTERRRNNQISEEAPEWIYQNYSGKWKLHDVEFRGNFHDYTVAKQEFELGQFFTPDWLLKKMVGLVNPTKKSRVIDISCWMWRVFNYIENEDWCHGIEIDDQVKDRCQILFPKAHLLQRSYESPVRSWHKSMDYSIGNPPFNIIFRWFYDHPLASQKDEEDGWRWVVVSQDMYVDATRYYLREAGVSIFVAPQSWLTLERHKKILNYINEHFYFIAEFDLPLDTFKEYQINFPTKVILLQKRRDGHQFIHDKYVGTMENFIGTKQHKFFLEQKQWLDDTHRRTALEALKSDAVARDIESYSRYKMIKRIWDYQNETGDRLIRPAETFQSIVIWSRYSSMVELEKTVMKKFKPKKKMRDYLWVRCYKRDYQICFDRTVPAVTEYLNRYEFKYGTIVDWEAKTRTYSIRYSFNINDLIIHQDTRDKFLYFVNFFRDNKLEMEYKGEVKEIKYAEEFDPIKFLNQRIKDYEHNSMDTALLQSTPEYEYWYEQLNDIEFWDKKLLPHQKEDLACMLQKRYALVSHWTWLGKTLTWIAWATFKWGKTLVVSPAVNVLDPWAQQLKEYTKKSAFILKKWKDIRKYNWEDFLVVSLESLPTISKSLRALHFRNLIVDESDNVKSKTSTRFKELRAMARNFKNKIMMSGTPTRNNVNEIYNQIELLCNNSVNMICYADKKIEYNRSYRDWRETRNENFMRPFPAWGGHKHFTETFSPKKLTCFWAAQTNQDIFQKDALDKLMRSVRFTRDFDIEKPRINAVLNIEDTWEHKEYKQILVPMNDKEKAVYEYILDAFAKEVEQYYRSRHDGATASMLVIMRQILNLMQGTSHPWTYHDENGVPIFWDEDIKTSSKIEKSMEIIEQAFKEWRKVMMASPWRDTADMLESKFIFKGFTTFRIESEMSKQKRASIVSEFRKYEWPAIITGTMGCLKSGLNLPEVSVVIAESYPWNFAQLHQYAARAVRLNSTEKTMIYCLCAEGSFDINVFALMLKKEVANTFIKSSDDVIVDELAKEFWTSTDVFGSAMQMVRERVWGRMKWSIAWWEKSLQSN